MLIFEVTSTEDNTFFVDTSAAELRRVGSRELKGFADRGGMKKADIIRLASPIHRCLDRGIPYNSRRTSVTLARDDKLLTDPILIRVVRKYQN